MTEITLAQRGAVEGLRRRWGHSLSSHAFPSLYLWREEMGLELQLAEDCFAVRAGGLGPNAWFFPCGSEAGRLAFLSEHLEEPEFTLLYLRGEDARWLEERFPERWALRRSPGADEYLYRRQTHIDLAGGGFRHIRRRLCRIRRELSPRTEPLCPANAADALAVTELWASQNPGSGPLDDRALVARALEQMEELELRGVVVYLRDHPAAFMMGFPLTEDTFDANLGKCAVGVQGLTYYALRELFASLPEKFAWCNLEEDLGLPGLREMKEHFLPEGRHEIWEARRI